MARKGLSHVGLSTLDMDRTRAFYEGVLGFKAVRCDTMRVKEGGQIRHVFFDAGDGQLLAFMEPRGVPGTPGAYDAGINRGLGLPDMFYHFAFEVGSLEALEAKRAELIAKGVRVTPVVDHECAASAATRPARRSRTRRSRAPAMRTARPSPRDAEAIPARRAARAPAGRGAPGFPSSRSRYPRPPVGEGRPLLAAAAGGSPMVRAAGY